VKTAQLQIRVTPAQKAFLKRRALEAGQDVSSYVLSRVAPDAALRFQRILSAVGETDGGSFALAELSDLLAGLSARELEHATAGGLPDGLSPRLQNLVAAMVEHCAAERHGAPPPWARRIPPLSAPWFAVDLPRLRGYLLRVSPTAFRRRNLFVDSTVGDRV